MSVGRTIVAILVPLCGVIALDDPMFARLSLSLLEATRAVCMEAGELLLVGMGIVDVRLVFASTFSLIFLAMMGVLSSLLRTRMLTAQLLKHQELPRRQGVGELATRLGIENQTSIVESEQLIAFCYGLLRPRIIVSTGLLDHLSDEEMEAVLRHEAWHARHHDSLIATVALGLRSGLFFLPPVARIVGRMLTTREIRADDAAIGGMGSPYPLASALSKALHWPEVSPKTTVSAFSAVDARIDHLLGEPRFPFRKRRRRAFLASLAPATALGLLLCALITASPVAAGLQARIQGVFCEIC